MLKVEMVERSCVNCSGKFRVSSNSRQTYCSNVCMSNGKTPSITDMNRFKDKPKPEPLRFNGAGEIIKSPRIVADVQKKENPVVQVKIEKPAPPIKAQVTVEKKELTDLEKWENYVERAKKIVRSMAKDRMDLAKIAIQACEINWGGGGHWSKHKDIYTLKKFAKDVGISYKTINNYIRAYRNVVAKLPEDVYDDSDYAALTRTANKVNSRTSKEEVTEIYKRENKRKIDHTLVMSTMIKRMKNLEFFVTSTALSKFAKEDLIELRQICRDIDQKISKYI